MPGTTPLTSQLALLISTTTTKVEIGSNAVRLRLRSLTWATGQPPSVRVDDEGAMTSAVRPIASLRPASPRGIRRGNSGQAFETQQAAFSVDNFKREPNRAAPCHLVPSGKEVSYALIDIVVDSPAGRTARSEAEVVRPTEQ